MTSTTEMAAIFLLIKTLDERFETLPTHPTQAQQRMYELKLTEWQQALTGYTPAEIMEGIRAWYRDPAIIKYHPIRPDQVIESCDWQREKARLDERRAKSLLPRAPKKSTPMPDYIRALYKRKPASEREAG